MRASTIFLFVAVVYGWSYDWPSAWESKWKLDPGAQQTLLSDTSCKVTRLTAYEMQKSNDPIFFSTGGLDHFLSPKIYPLNKTAGEQWEFDGVSSDAKQGFVFGFYHDPNYSILGTGNLRVSIEMVWANGTRFAQIDYPSESIIEECSWGTRGIWRSDDYSYEFEVTADLQTARIGMETSQYSGVIAMSSVARPRYPDGKTYPSENSTSEALPHFHFVDPIPAAIADVDMVIQGEPFVWKGMGGMTRLFGAFSWFTCLKGMQFIRALVGPYALTMFTFTSKFKKGEVYPSVALWENGIPIFANQRTEESDTEDYFTFTKTYHGRVQAALRDKVTGYELELVSNRQKKHWTFIVEHEVVAFEFILGGGHGGTGFIASVQGGRVAREQFLGTAMTEALIFPEKSPLFRTQYSWS